MIIKSAAPLLTLANTVRMHCAGMGLSKKWKYTVRIYDPAEPFGGETVGSWMEQNGLMERNPRCPRLSWHFGLPADIPREQQHQSQSPSYTEMLPRAEAGRLLGSVPALALAAA